MVVHIFAPRIVTILGASLVMCISGCKDSGFRTTQSKLGATIEFVERNYSRSPQAWARDKAACMRSELHSATAESLREPRICYAVMIRGGDSPSCSLFVSWIEDHPTPDGMRFLLGPNSTPIDATIWKPFADANELSAKKRVLFSGGPNFSDDSEEVTALWQATEVLVVLTKNGQPISNTAPLHRIDADGSELKRQAGEPETE